ncbi:transcription initiation factor TFIID subunit 9-like [Melanaphis sacchari]|uniref:transcription initiation factor TFIID subunit 9-like n=1 Tax=Melanaphis sacchari TaxID=742174 RepID=UPI000DC1420B|nr:transcription initiation factor TFIID subunit 9-like [Melanaphis sacchari]
MSPPKGKLLLKDSQVVVAMMKNLGIRDCDEHIVNHLLEFNNYKSISLILEEAKSCATFANKSTIEVDDIQVAIKMAKDIGLHKSPPTNKLNNVANVSNKTLLPAMNPKGRLRKHKDGSHFSAKIHKLKTHTDTGLNAWKNMIERTAAEILNMDKLTRTDANINIPILTGQCPDELPVLTDLDVEEVISDQQNNQEVTTHKVNDFNVDALLNDPYSL